VNLRKVPTQSGVAISRKCCFPHGRRPIVGKNGQVTQCGRSKRFLVEAIRIGQAGRRDHTYASLIEKMPQHMSQFMHPKQLSATSPSFSTISILDKSPKEIVEKLGLVADGCSQKKIWANETAGWACFFKAFLRGVVAQIEYSHPRKVPRKDTPESRPTRCFVCSNLRLGCIHLDVP